MPERFEICKVYKWHYINTLPFLSFTGQASVNSTDTRDNLYRTLCTLFRQISNCTESAMWSWCIKWLMI